MDLILPIWIVTLLVAYSAGLIMGIVVIKWGWDLQNPSSPIGMGPQSVPSSWLPSTHQAIFAPDARKFKPQAPPTDARLAEQERKIDDTESLFY